MNLFKSPCAVSDCNTLLSLSFFILLVAAFYRPGKCFRPCFASDLTAGCFAAFLKKLSRPLPRCLLLSLGAAHCLYVLFNTKFGGS